MDVLKEKFKNYKPVQKDLPNSNLRKFERLLNRELHKRIIIIRLAIGVAAASIAILFLLPYIYSSPINKNDIILSSADEEIIESEYYLRNEIARRMLIIDSLETNKNTNKTLVSDLSDLDESLTKLRSDLKQSPNDVRIINAVINTYRLKLEALDNILNLIHKYS